MNSRLSFAIGAAVVVTLASASAQQAKPAAATGTAIVSGVVISATDGTQPVRRAIVKLSGRGELSRSAVTDDDGRFAIGFLPGGTYTLTVSKPAYVTTTFGAIAPGRAGTPFVLKEGETIASLRIPIFRGAAISGTVRDQAGGAAEGVQVFAARVELSKARQTDALLSGGAESVTTDDMGGYRIYGLAPGTYLVGALSQIRTPGGVGAPTRDQIDTDLRLLQQRTPGASIAAAATPAVGPAPPGQRFGYGPVYHPSAVAAAQAATVTVGPGDDRGGTDIFLMLAPIGAIEGRVVGADGQPAPNVSLSISTLGPPLPTSFGLFPVAPLPGPEGQFRFPNVPPGTWTITARSSARVIRRNPDGSLSSTSGDANELPPGTFHWAAQTLDVNGGTTSVTLNLRPGLTMTGRVMFDGTPLTAAKATEVRLSMAPDPDPSRAATALFPASPPAVANPKADGSFELRGLTPGPWTLTAVVPGASGPGGWWLRSAMMNGKDLLDAPIDVGERDLANVEVTLSNRHTSMSGTLMGADGKPLSNLVIVAMPEDRALWMSVRRVQQTRPATDGRFSFADLPPGGYLLAAVTDIAEAEWRTGAFLASIAPAGVRVVLGEGEKKTQDLRVGGR